MMNFHDTSNPFVFSKKKVLYFFGIIRHNYLPTKGGIVVCLLKYSTRNLTGQKNARHVEERYQQIKSLLCGSSLLEKKSIVEDHVGLRSSKK